MREKKNRQLKYFAHILMHTTKKNHARGERIPKKKKREDENDTDREQT